MQFLKFLFILFFSFITTNNAEAKVKKNPAQIAKKKESKEKNILEPYGVEVNSTHALLVDHQTGKILLEKNANQPFEPASMTKIMTAYMVMKALKEGRIKPESLVTISSNARSIEKGSSDMFLEIGDQVSVQDLLMGLIIVSGNDAAIALAEYLSGIQSAFASDMNYVAKELGCSQTEFKNASGLPEEGHLTTAHDLIIMSQKTLEDFPEWYSIHKELKFKYRNIEQPNRNLLLNKNIGCDGVKTGFASKPGYGMVASAVQNGRRLFLVVTGLHTMKERADEAYRLLQWGFGTFGNYTIMPEGKSILEIPVRYGSQEMVEIIADQHLLTLHRNRIHQIKAAIKYRTVLEAPFKAGTQVGEVILTHPDWQEKVIIPLVAKKDISRASFLSRIGQTLKYLFQKDS